jgi:hypothetical protein
MVSEGRKLTKKDLKSKTEPPPKNCLRCGNELTEGVLIASEVYVLDRFSGPAEKMYPEDPHCCHITHPDYSLTALACKKCGWTELHTNFGEVRGF